MRGLGIFSVFLLLAVTRAQNLEKETCEATRAMVGVETSGAQAMIGGLFEVRSPNQGGYACGQPHKELIQVYEAARWALQRVNANNVVPGVKIGMTAYDTCGLRSLAIKYAEHFYPQYSSMQSSCSQNSTISLGFLGPLSSWTSKPVAVLASSWPASVLSPRAASPELSNKQMYPYFLRTSPSSAEQARAILAVLNQLSWKRIVVVKSSSEYGNDGYMTFLRHAYNSGICITKLITLPLYGTDAQYRQQLANIANLNARVAVFFGSYVNALTLFTALESVGGAGNMQFVFTDLNLMEAYSSRMARGAIYVGPEFKEVTEFANYFVGLNENFPPNENPWFKDWYMTHYKCNLGVSYQPYISYGPCTSLTLNQKLAAFKQVPYVTSTVKAVYAYAQALREAHKQKCGSIPGLCNGLQTMTTQDFHNNYLQSVNFQFAASDGILSLVGEQVRFDRNGDMPTSSYAVYNYNNRTGAFAFEKVGTFIAETLNLDASKIIVYDSLRDSALTALPLSTCPAGGCSSCLIHRGMVDFYYTPGDVVIGGALDVHSAGMMPVSCGSAITYGLAASAAFEYGIRTAKTALPGILNGVTLGSIIMDTCESAQTGLLFMNNVLGERHIVRDRMGRLVDPNAIKAFVEVMGTDETKEFSVGLQPFKLPEIGTIATSVELQNKMMYPHYTRVVPGDDKQVGAMIALLAKMGWTYIQTLQSPNAYARTGVRTLREIGKFYSICVSASYEFGTDGNYAEVLEKLRMNSRSRVVVIFSTVSETRAMFQALRSIGWQRDFIFIGADYWATSREVVSGFEDIANGSITFEPASYGTTGFRNWLNSLNPREEMDIPWFREWYQRVYNCYIDAEKKGMYSSECTGSPITSAQAYAEGYEVSYTINAVYAVAKALDQTLTFFCGNGYSGVCSSFRASPFVQETILQYLKNSTFFTENKLLFEMINGEGTPVYNIFSYRNGNYLNVGYYDTKSSQSTITQQNIVYPSNINPSTFSSYCTGTCYECAYTTEAPKYHDIPGDIKIGGLFGVHSPNQINPLACGFMNTVNGFQFGSAMAYAIERVNSKAAPVSLNGIQLGGTIFDHCSVESRAFNTLTSLYSGTLPTYFWRMDKFEPNKFGAWITDNTAAVMEVQEPVSRLNLPLLSPLATSEELSDLEKYPTYFKTISGDVSLSIAMAELAQSLDFKYVTVVYSDSAYGMGGMETFASVVQQEGICIVQKYKMDKSMTAAQIINAIQNGPSHVVILWTGVRDTTELLDARRNNPSASNMVFIFPMPFMSLVSQFGANAANTFMINIKNSTIAGYHTFMEQMYSQGAGDSPLLLEYYMTIFQCDLPGYSYFSKQCSTRNGKLIPVTEAPGYAQDNYVIPTINAVYAYVAALDATLIEKCGANYNGLCSSFTSAPNINSLIIKNMESVSFRDPAGATFQFLDREGNSGLDVFYFDGTTTRMVGDFAGASLQITDNTLTSRFTSTKSGCNQPCSVCIQQSLNFTYIPGDVLVGGIFDVHENDLTPFSCGPLKTFHGFQLLEAFNYAINKVNDKTGQFANILKNVRLGGIGLDSCQSSIRTGYMVSNIHSGLTKLTRNGFTLNPDDINAYIAGYSSDSSIYLARILKTLKIPQISYASTSTELMDTDKYPYFLRSVPADDKQSMAMIEFFKKYNIHYVQIVNTPTNYGERGAKIFFEKAKENKICVAQTVPFPDNGTVTQESANDVISSLLTRPMANTVVVFADQDYINEMLRAVSRNPDAVGKFRFIGSDTWSNNLEAISGVESLAEGSVTLNLESSDIPDFDLYLGKKTPGNYPENPWFPEFYERMVDCYLTVPTRTRTVQCPSIPENIVAQRNYVQDPAILHVINAVYAAAIGIDLALKAECGENYTTVCEKYKNSQDRTNLLMTSIQRARFTDPANKNFEFSSRREGNKGYQLFSITKKMTMSDVGYTYDKFGAVSSDGQLTTLQSYRLSWDGSCDRDDACNECPLLRNRLSRYMLQPATVPNAATIVAFVNVHLQGDETYKCSNMDREEFYRTLAFFYTLENLSPRPYGLRGIAIDTCSNYLRVDQDTFSLLSSGKLCNTAFTFDGVIDNSTIAGFTTAFSSNVEAINRVTSSIAIPIVSGGATSTTLSNKGKFPYFARTVPPDDKQMSVIADILNQNGWKYVSAIYSRETYGLGGITALRNAGKSSNICLGSTFSLPYPGTMDEAKAIIERLSDTPEAKVVILISLNPRLILQAAKEMGVLNEYIWLGTDFWGTKHEMVEGMEEDLLGTITIEVRSAIVRKFITYITELTYYNRKNIPNDWFEEFYQRIHQCSLSNAAEVLNQYPPCTLNEVISESMVTEHSFMLHTIAATYALAKAVNDVADTYCPSTSTFQQCFAIERNRERLFSSLLQVTWNMHEEGLDLIPSETFSLSFNGDRFWDIGYTIHNYVKSGNTYQYLQIGSSTNGRTTFDNYNNYKQGAWISECTSDSCQCDGLAPVTQAIVQNLTIALPEARNYFYYIESRNAFNRAVYDLVYGWPIWAIAVCVCTCAGMILAMLLFIYLMIKYPVRGGTTILGFLMLFGVIGIYAINFAFFFPASEAACCSRRLLLGFVYTIVFASLFVKAVDNWRFSDFEYTVHKYKGLTSSCTLLMVTIGIILVELIIPIEWLILVPPTASNINPAAALDDWMWCDPVDNYDRDLVLSMLFVIFLVILTAIFSGLAWNSDSNYYESRWIFVSSVCTAGCMLVWMIVVTNAGPSYRDPAVALANMVNATALLICVPIRKVVLLFKFKQEENLEKAQSLAEIDKATEAYSTVYSNPGYEDTFVANNTAGSKHSGSDIGF